MKRSITKPSDFELPPAGKKTCMPDEITISHTFLTKDSLISQTDFVSLTGDKKEILLNRIPQWIGIVDNGKINKCISMVLLVWDYKYNSTRTNYGDFDSICQCSLEIFYHGYVEKEAFHRIQWCHKIQNTITTSELKEGWRVSFGKDGNSDRYYYTNDILQKQKIITFNKHEI